VPAPYRLRARCRDAADDLAVRRTGDAEKPLRERVIGIARRQSGRAPERADAGAHAS
jgi:hypothetical protein